MAQKIILLADDDNDDTEMFSEALTNADSDITCHCVSNGVEALNKLETLSGMPHLIFLDLNMPLMDGWLCLKVLKEDDRFRQIPVIMISTSSHEKDIAMASELGAFGYFVKPNDFHELNSILKAITAGLSSDLKDTVLSLEANGSGKVFAGKSIQLS